MEKQRNALLARLICGVTIVYITTLVFMVHSQTAHATGSQSETSTIKLPWPQNREDVQYLGLKEGASFEIKEINASVIIIEIFSLYCSLCQKEAKQVNELYNMIINNTKLESKIKIIGIGAGNSAKEVASFKQRHKVPFPLFPDNKARIMKSLGQKITPTFMCFKINKDGSLQKLFAKSGPLGTPSAFLAQVQRLSGI